MQSVSHKRGDTLTWACMWTDDAGDPVDLTGHAIASHLRGPTDDLVQELAVVIGDQVLETGTFTISATAAESALWPVADLTCDIELTDPGGVVSSTDTFRVRVQRDVTR